MEVYRESLLNEIREDDPFSISCWPEKGTPASGGQRLAKAYGNYIEFPSRVRNFREKGLVHLLDHSLAHLLKSVDRKSAKVVTLHDLIPLRMAGGLTARQVERFRSKATLLHRADFVISVSEHSKTEAVDLLGLDEERVIVVPNGVTKPKNVPSASEVVEKLRQRGASKVVLSVGSRLERKNLKILPAVFKELKRVQDEPVALLRVGPMLEVELRSKLEAVLGSDLFFEAGRSSNEDLWAAYEAVNAVVVPSLYEGFGLPVMEAFACGTPVASSSSSSLPEVGGDLASYFSPDDPEEAADALRCCLFDSVIRNASHERRARAAEFTWRRHLEGCYRIYQQALETS